ncbi:hypothetical protein [Paenibacillus roseipurpureus]|uniref:Uncharacterized protein n=1 Tax=Paenibacillus roseopurpureus TaxID=2918901 RepID=A0AA96LTG3_9BACL|nr:hypothetical protein [Paenibacillus sp. MBLB1832]WNR46211.1 hypothetical protein MJB10_09000 [Paenibacillus sp. MBLB1832]
MTAYAGVHLLVCVFTYGRVRWVRILAAHSHRITLCLKRPTVNRPEGKSKSGGDDLVKEMSDLYAAAKK